MIIPFSISSLSSFTWLSLWRSFPLDLVLLSLQTLFWPLITSPQLQNPVHAELCWNETARSSDFSHFPSPSLLQPLFNQVFYYLSFSFQLWCILYTLASSVSCCLSYETRCLGSTARASGDDLLLLLNLSFSKVEQRGVFSSTCYSIMTWFLELKIF